MTNALKKEDLQNRLAGFMPEAQKQDGATILQEAVKRDPSTFSQALQLLEDMAKAGEELTDRYGYSIEYYIANLGGYNYRSLGAMHHQGEKEPQSSIAAKIRTLLRLGTSKALEYVPGLLEKMENRESAVLWGEITEDETEAGVARVINICRKLTDDFGQRGRDFLLRVSGADVAGTEAAYKWVKGNADGGDQDYITHLLNMGTPRGDLDGRQALEKSLLRALERQRYGSGNAYEIVRQMDSPVAYQVYTGIAVEYPQYAPDIIHALNAESLRNGLEADTSPYIGNIRAALDERLDEHEMFITAVVLSHETEDALDDYAESAHSDAYHAMQAGVDEIKGFRIMAMYPESTKPETWWTERNVVKQLKKIVQAKPELTDEYLTRLLARKTIIATWAAMDTALELSGGDKAQQELARKHVPGILANFTAPELDMNGEDVQSRRQGLQIMGKTKPLATLELARQVITVLAGQRTKEAYADIYYTLVKSEYQEKYDPAKQSLILDRSDRDYYPEHGYKTCIWPKLAPFAMDAIMAQEKPGKAGYQYIRYIANSFRDELPQRAHDFFNRDGSRGALSEIRFLKGMDAVSALAKLDDAASIPELKKQFARAPYGSLNTVLDKRDAAQAAGVNDTALHDEAVSYMVGRLADRKRVLQEIANGNKDELKAAFERTAKAGLIDACAVFKAAVDFIEQQQRLARVDEVLDNAIAAMTPKVK